MGTLRTAVNASASALEVERARIEVAVSNMANAESTRGPDGQPYRRRNVLLAAAPEGGFQAALSGATAVGVRLDGVVEDQSPFRRRYDPAHPDADREGFVAMPNVDAPEELVDMLSATRAYQANITAIGLIREMVQKALELGK
jgi:flagellar basal-body rod protein FlgC